MEDTLGPLLLLACGVFVVCIGVFNSRWFILMRGSPLNPFLPQIFIRVIYAFLGLVVITLAVLMLAGFDLRSTPIVSIEVDGSPGMKLVVTVKADNEEGKIEGPIPNAIPATGQNVAYTVENVGETGTMTVLVNGYLMNTMVVDEDHPIVRGTVVRGRVSQNAEQKRHP
jgi:hypothetical protein